MQESTKQFDEGFEAYSDELFRHCVLRLSDRDRALELTQECFLKAWQYQQKGGEIRELRPFLYRTLHNLIIDEYRKKKAVSLEGLAERYEGSIDEYLPPDEGNTIAAAIERFEGAAALEALKKLPEPYREAVTLRYVDGLSPQEIAQITGETENVVSVRVHRGLKKLKAMLEHESQ